MAVKTVKLSPVKGSFGKPELLAMGVGQVIGAGVVTYTVLGLKMTGYSAWLAYLLAVVVGFIMVLPNLLASSAVRMNGGFYGVVSSTLGGKAAGIFTYMNVVQTLGIAMFCTSCAAYLGDIIAPIGGPTARMLVSVGLLTLFYVINMMGVDVMAKVQKLMVWILMAALGLFIIIGIPRIHLPIFNFSDPNFFTNGMAVFAENGTLAGGFLAAFFAFLGSTYGYGNVVGFGGQAKNPRKDMPVVMILSALIILVLYVGVAIVATGCMTVEEYGESTTLVFVAQRILPGPLFVLFIIGGPVMALLTTLNGSFSFSTITMAKGCEDGWFPKKLAAKNKRGAYKYMLTIIYLIGVIPLLLQFSIYTLLNQIQLLTSSVVLIYLAGFFLIPKKFPKAWAKSTLHVPKALYYVSCTVAMAVFLAILIKSCISITPSIVFWSLLAFAVCIGLGIFRAKTGDITLYDSIWGEDEETAEA